MGINDTMAVHTEKASTNHDVGSAPDFTVKAGLAQMLKGGVIMDVVNAEQVILPSTLSQGPSKSFDTGHGRHELRRKLGPALSWPWSVSPLTSAATVVSPGCLIPL
jgi:SOR/SNZ family